ncbi:MAG: hypothetical protein AAGC65_17100 [Mucilaginibacter sp.]|uniref:hypothetical protein n=1 Tax=Mucilaginibacter sp. TaxID=1882438 RepID=UPI0031AD8D89
MNEQLDNDLSNRIREVFDNFEDPSYPSADEGWLLLRNKFPETEKKRPVAWLWWASAAAAILLFISIGLWMMNPAKQKSETLTAKQVKKEQKLTNPDTTTQLVVKQAPVIKNNTATDLSANNNALPASKQQTIKPLAPAAINSNAPAYANTVTKSTQQQPLTKITKAIADTSLKTNTAQYAANPTGTPVVAGSKNTANSGIVPGKPENGIQQAAVATNAPQYGAVLPANNSSKSVVAAPSNNSSTTPAMVNTPQAKGPTQPKANSMAALFASESNTPKPDEKYSEDKKVRFGVYAATFFNYAKGSANQVNAGVGFSSDIKLSKNIKLSTGLALAQNTLSYGSNNIPLNYYSSAVAKPQALASAYDKENLFAANTSFPVLKNYNANLVGLDIPLNLKYEFNPQKSDTYISAGLSSGTFINEAYTSVYGYSSSSIAAGASQQTTDETTRKNFTGFYFAKTLNVSFGVGYPIGKSNRIVIEPFLKYPLDGLGSQQLRFGAGGLNLKLNFTSPKK